MGILLSRWGDALRHGLTVRDEKDTPDAQGSHKRAVKLK
jgi:hypothetical protein